MSPISLFLNPNNPEKLDQILYPEYLILSENKSKHPRSRVVKTKGGLKIGRVYRVVHTFPNNNDEKHYLIPLKVRMKPEPQVTGLFYESPRVLNNTSDCNFAIPGEIKTIELWKLGLSANKFGYWVTNQYLLRTDIKGLLYSSALELHDRYLRILSVLTNPRRRLK